MPDGFYGWDTGLQDYRRDPGMMGFLTASVFLMLSLYLGQWRSSHRFRIAVATGGAAGLTLISRDTAALYLLGLFVVPCIALFANEIRQRGFGCRNEPDLACSPGWSALGLIFPGAHSSDGGTPV